MNQAPYAKTIRKNQPPKVPAEMKEVDVPTRTDADYRSVSEAIAQHRIYERGKFFPEFKTAFPALWRLWHVDRFFPYAKGGELLVDEPATQADYAESMMKKEVALKMGLRMIVIRHSDSLEDSRKQLYEVDECGKTLKLNSANS